MKCEFCGRTNHRTEDCRVENANKTKTNNQNTFNVEEICTNMPTSHSLDWCLDSGTTSHMCKEESKFKSIKQGVGGVKLANGQIAPIAGQGFIRLELKNNELVNIPDTLLVPKLTTNLLSVGKIADKGFTITFKKDGAEVIDKYKNIVAKAIGKDGLYYIEEKKTDKSNLIKK